MNEDQTYQLIENYLKGELSGEELRAFEKELEQNQSLRKKVEAHKLANEMVIEYRLKNVQSILVEEQLKYGRTSLWKKIVSGILGGLLLSSLLFFLWDKDSSTSDILTPSGKSKYDLPEKNSGVVKENKNEELTTVYLKPTRKQIVETKTKDLVIHDSIIKTSHVKPLELLNPTHSVTNIHPEPGIPIPSKEAANACDLVDIQFHISLTASCEGENNGSIIISGFKGGTAPYHYYVSQNDNGFTNSNLPAGTYTVVINDSKGCIKNIPAVEVKEKHCQKDYSFNPSLGETWEIPTYKNSGTLILYDEAGIVYFTEEIGAGEKQQWTGQSKNGETKTGYFLFVIKYKDGTSRQGSVTIVR